MARQPDVLIVGGGVIGLTTAYFLAVEGLAVEVVDQGDFGQEASWAGAGILPPGNPEKTRHPYDKLRALGATLFPGLSHELKEATGVDNGYLRCGGLEFLEDLDGAIAGLWNEEGIAFERVQGPEIQRLEPAVNPDKGPAYFLPDLAQLRNPRHLKALVAGCRQRGVDLRPNCPVRSFDRKGRQVVAVRTDAGSRSTGHFVLAAGAWSDELLEPLGWRPGIHPVRGQIALLNTGAPVLRRVVMQHKRYFVPRADGRVLVGATEEDVGFDKHTTVGGIGGLLAFAVDLVPTLASASLERCWAGLRPGTPDGYPYLGRVPEVENLIVAAGHFRAGIQLSPATAMVVKELILRQELTVPLDAFHLDRTPIPAGPAAFRS